MGLRARLVAGGFVIRMVWKGVCDVPTCNRLDKDNDFVAILFKVVNS